MKQMDRAGRKRDRERDRGRDREREREREREDDGDKTNEPVTEEVLDREQLGTDLTSWVIGPYHGALPGPMRLHLKLDGEVIVAGTAENGYLHRGLEKTLELHTWQASVAYSDHLDPEGAAFGELALCLAVEEIGGIEVPLRAQSIRAILSELTRISCHLGYIARMARAVGSETMVHYVLRDRERVLDLFELLTGARFSLNFLRFGGVSSDVTEGFMERVLEVCDMVRLRLKEYNDLFTFNHGFRKRTTNIATIHPDRVRSLGISGPNARASGVGGDIRKLHPYTGYDRIDFTIPMGQAQPGRSGDAHERFLMRLREISQSIEILKQVVESVPRGPFTSIKVDKNFSLPAGEAYARIESSRGLLACHVVSNGTNKPARVQFRAPSLANLMMVPELVVGARIEDLPVIFASLDIGVAEVDR